MPGRGKVPIRSSVSKLQRQIDEIRAGRSSSLDLSRWKEDQRSELDRKMKQVGQEYLQGIREELDLYARIRNTIAGIIDVLADMNTLTSEMHADTDFEQLYAQLTAALR